MKSNLWFSIVTLPTHITLLRLILVPFIVMQILANDMFLASVLFLIAGLTDIIDGALARSLNATSELGALLDPLADKFLLISCYACLTYSQYMFNMIPRWFLIAVILNELILMSGSLYLFIRKGVPVAPTRIGKMASFIQILFIGWLFICSWAHVAPGLLLYLLLMLILCIRVWVLVHYSSRAFYGGRS